jgi:hypothetical protein
MRLRYRPMNSGRWGICAGIIIAPILALLCAAIGVSFVANALSAGRSDYSGPGATYAFAAAAGSFVLFGLLVWMTIQFEHRLRSTASGPDDFFNGSAPNDHGWRRGHHRQAPVAISFFLLVYLSAVIGFAVYAINIGSQGALSSHVQHAGVPRTGRIISVQNVEHQGPRSGPWYSALITVTLAPPVDGHSTTTVHDPQASNLIAGEGLQILVDPQEPGYAELPGHPFVPSWLWIIPATGSLAFCLIGLLPTATMIVRMVGRHRRRGNLLGEHRRRRVLPGQ